MVGVGLAYSAILIPQLESEDSDISVTEDELSWIASVVPLVAPLGSIMAGFLMDRFGRLNTLKISVIPGIAAWVLMALAYNVPMLVAARVFTGLAARRYTLGINFYLISV